MSLPELPATTVTVTGRVRTVARRTLIVLPFAAPTGPGRGRRFRIETGTTTPFFRVVLSVGGRAAMRPPDQVALWEGDSLTMRIRVCSARRTRRVPADLDRALAAAETGLDGLDESTVRHLLSMVTEARDPQIRATRITAAVAAAEQIRGAD